MRTFAMQDDRPISVLILYAHPLLGEGLAELLTAEPGLEVVAVQGNDDAMVERELAATPDVIIFERGDPDRAVKILEVVPDALIIDVGIDPGPTFTYRREEISAWPDAIFESIRQASSRRRSGQAPVLKASPRVTVGS
jgi:DNA-binding NarL/FixJ family response regulator